MRIPTDAAVFAVSLALAVVLPACGGSQAPSGAGSCALAIGRPTVRGSLPAARALRVLQSQSGRLERCLSHEPAEVAITLRLVVPASGEPSRVLITEGLITEERTGECLERQLRRLRFPST